MIGKLFIHGATHQQRSYMMSNRIIPTDAELKATRFNQDVPYRKYYETSVSFTIIVEEATGKTKVLFQDGVGDWCEFEPVTAEPRDIIAALNLLLME